MSQLALLLVLISAVTHSVWNLQVKRAGDKFVFVWLLVVVGWALAFPVWVTKWPELQAMPRGVWLLALASGACYAGYFTLLGRSYQSGAVSVAYPITRGVGPLGVMLLAVLLLGEPVSVAGIAGGLLIVLSAVALAWPDREGEGPSRVSALTALYAVGTGICSALYSVIDKQAVVQVDPAAYLPLTYGIGICFLTPVIWRVVGWRAVAAEWRRAPRSVVGSGALSIGGYFLVLYALQTAPVAYVVPVRSVSVMITVLMGSVLLGEGRLARRLAFSAGVMGGLALLVQAG